MKNRSNIAIAAATALIALSSCAKLQSAATYEADKRYYDAWLQVNHAGAKMLGDIAILEDEIGSGEVIADSSYIMVQFTVRELDGTVSETCDEAIAKQIGVYSPETYYGPKVWETTQDALTVGVERAIKGDALIKDAGIGQMRIGGKRTFVVPLWLGGKTRYDKEEDYLKNKSGASNLIYELSIVDASDNILRWQRDSMQRFSRKHLGGIDTLSLGFYYKQLREPSDTATPSNDTTMYINYIGRLLNGQVFDTNVADTAKMYKLYSAAKTYEPSEITWNEDPSNVKLASSTVISGWGKAVSKMRKGEKCVVMFDSSLGYQSSGSGNSIPPYSPLLFELEFVEKE